ncbi:hypothetical protein [Streptococcus pyogenes]|uniref:hypothetical protein n=1 Tax=Streptococcus pyogenes TaxID=1314 RepID=UPI0010A14CBD|nr:hypothetical protein [Streptococcus pyogenes]VGW24449.1 Uncharacterised protein [Streptococcus pyogenes]VGW28220.1 Uncharacterised protein [Streptococcus pyogenes]VGW29067.1 Uncharacterised protein [Streptococcus pyogenes]VGW36315.1 Uncharacterised protein [Streptococcus pyogenes]VGW38700.1 Uncharacterised protein [Streptococcus pyogenes]
MKTKSKRFLNLATLCLALFGAVWIGRPIEARHSTEDTVVQGLRSYPSDSEEEQQQRVNDAHDRGHADGYQDGREGIPKKDREEIKNTPQGIDKTELSDYWDSYEISYDEGYKQWSGEHPVEATLSWIWETITSWVRSIF